MARPKLNIDPKTVRTLASLGCKNTEIAAHFGCSVDVIERRFAGELAKGRASLKMSLRQWQLKAAEKGNPALLIFLGKQLLGQLDVPVDDDAEEVYQRPDSMKDDRK